MIIKLLAVLVALIPAWLHADDAETKPETRTVLLAFEKTRFKNTLIEELQTVLQKHSMTVKTVEHSNSTMDVIDPSQYDVVFVTNSGVNSKVRPWLVEWLDKHKESSTKILLHTTQTRTWEPDISVDAVTSASSMKDVKELATKYADLIIQKHTAGLSNSEEKETVTE